jgi:hypothetical protein
VDVGLGVPPVADVLRLADHLEHDLGRGVDVDLALDAGVLHGASSISNLRLRINLAARAAKRNHQLLDGYGTPLVGAIVGGVVAARSTRNRGGRG